MPARAVNAALPALGAAAAAAALGEANAVGFAGAGSAQAVNAHIAGCSVRRPQGALRAQPQRGGAQGLGHLRWHGALLIGTVIGRQTVPDARGGRKNRN